MILLLAQNEPQPVEIAVVELAIARRRALGIDESLTLEKADLGDRDVGKLLEQQPEYFTDREVRPLVEHHSAHPVEEDQPELADLDLVTVGQRRFIDTMLVHVGAVQGTDIAHSVRITDARDF